MKRSLLIILGIVTLLAGCNLAPTYRRPDSPVPASWPTGGVYGETKPASEAQAVSAPPWRDFFPDERLQKVIALALRENRDLRLAVLNVQKARAIYGVQRAELLPSVNAAGNMSKGRVPADLSYTGKEYTSEQYSVNLGISSWEIDFFGRLRSLKDRALEEYLASEQARRGAQITIVSTAANIYLTLAADRETLALAVSTLEAQEAAYRLVKKRYDVGMASELDLRRSQSQMETARVDVGRYRQIVAQDENALQLLVGSVVSQDILPSSLDQVKSPQEATPGLSSELLLQRPDVLASEHRLKGANANIGAARAAFFPRISLTTSFGTASAQLSGLFKDGSSTWNFAPQIVLPIFDGRTWSAYDVTKTEREIAVAQYEKTIQEAFREVSDALAVQGAVNQRITAQESLVRAVSETYRLSNVRYTKGIDSYLSVLDAQRSLYGAQQGLIALRLAKLANRVTLYKVLGGGA